MKTYGKMLKDASTKLNDVIKGKKIFETVTTIEELHTFSLFYFISLYFLGYISFHCFYLPTSVLFICVISMIFGFICSIGFVISLNIDKGESSGSEYNGKF